MTLARRMSDEARMKAKARRTLITNTKTLGDDPKAIGKHYSTHGAACSCWMCGNPRKYFNEPSLAEKKQNDRDADV